MKIKELGKELLIVIKPGLKLMGRDIAEKIILDKFYDLGLEKLKKLIKGEVDDFVIDKFKPQGRAVLQKLIVKYLS